ncbi:DegQ family serine endoprotease [Roseospira goensis]|uniref:Serine protease Do n=1 Tax=Roseospira goensis TaxID=391922 RepID=A0A7W6WKC3_9PROT|nr:DegQ family serine endoprotease [Roseospira goensis]MBB4285614.1 serine protease Do [Roseospira goensis]
MPLSRSAPPVLAAGLALLVALVLALALPPAAQAQQVPQSRAEIALSFAPVVERAAPAVVNIYSRRVVRDRRVPPLFDDPFFRHFFGRDFGPARPRERVENALGSGVIVRTDGVILTNRHVIEGADEITVVLNDRREFDARVLGEDERSDLAVLTIDTGGESLPALPLGDSEALQVGDLVLAIGNPFGVGQTVTMGIVSALARTTVGISDYRSFIQTDAAINPGNSGGALVDMAGRLVGINTAIYSQDGGSVGIGFAVPATMARMVVDSLLAGGTVTRPWLGIDGQTVTGDIARSLGLSRPVGVLVTEALSQGPARAAGLRRGDVILAYNGRAVDGEEVLRYRIGTSPVGGTATLRVWRDGDTRDIRVDLRPPPEDPPRTPTRLRGRHPLNDVTVANLNPALAEEMRLPHGQGSVVVLDLGRTSVAGRFGLRPGDVIRAVNGREPTDVRDLDRLMRRTGPPWRLEILREGRPARVVIGG